jgi:uncharacterized DUF497 family protein
MKSKLTWDEVKREVTLLDRGLDFADAVYVLASIVFEYEDTRQVYGECRMICFGLLSNRLVVVGYVQRGRERHIFSTRKANDREKAKFGK